MAAMMFTRGAALAGRRGWISPCRSLTDTLWRRSGIRIVRNPRSNLIASLMLLVVLASCAGLASYNYDDRKASFARLGREPAGL